MNVGNEGLLVPSRLRGEPGGMSVVVVELAAEMAQDVLDGAAKHPSLISIEQME